MQSFFAGFQLILSYFECKYLEEQINGTNFSFMSFDKTILEQFLMNFQID